MAKHKKQYARKGEGVELYCGDKLIASHPHRWSNFMIYCPVCEMEVQTRGCSLETDEVFEYKRKRMEDVHENVTEVEKMFRIECEEIGIDYSEFPFEFLESSSVSYSAIFAAIMWILKKRQDKTLEEFDRRIGRCVVGT